MPQDIIQDILPTDILNKPLIERKIIKDALDAIYGMREDTKIIQQPFDPLGSCNRDSTHRRRDRRAQSGGRQSKF
jgi:hypothetical protein